MCDIVVDAVLVMVDVSDKWACGKLDYEILKCLTQNPDIPTVLVLNKVLTPEPYRIRDTLTFRREDRSSR